MSTLTGEFVYKYRSRCLEVPKPEMAAEKFPVTWQALESNPETINPFLNKIGISSVQCVDVFSFDEDALEFIPKPQLAMILCWPDYKKVDEIMKPIFEKLSAEGATEHPEVFFMKQKIHNACGTFALFHALANLDGTVDLGSGSFRTWLDKAKAAGIEERSEILQNDTSLAAAHDAAAESGESEQPEKVEHHFVCYVNKDGKLYEIDSRAPFPRVVGVTSSETLVRDAGAACKHLMEKLDNVSFAAMAIVPN